MNRFTLSIVFALAVITSILAGRSVFAEDNPRYEVTITNLTRGQQFTPILVASHGEGISLFKLGKAASPQLATLAEEGDAGPLTALLSGMPEVKDVASSGGLLDPGKSVTVTVKTGGAFNHISVAAMLIPTNDGFFALNGVEGPRRKETLTFFSPAYDAGSEQNDELCASIPGPFFTECGGPGGGGMPTGDEEGYVHIHAGIHGIGDLDAAERDWRNPVAKIIIRRIH
jgi:Spondin_N